MAAISERQVINALKERSDLLIEKPYFGNPYITDEAFEEKWQFSSKILDKLISESKVEFSGEDNQFWETKYYKVKDSVAECIEIVDGGYGIN